MEVKRVSGTPSLPVETIQPQTQSAQKISRGIAEASDSFETLQRPPTNDLFLELQKRQFAVGSFINTSASPASKAAISEQDLNAITATLKDAVLGSSSPEEIAKALQKVIGVINSFQPTGPIIAAVLAAVAAVMNIIGQITQKQLEEQAQTKEKTDETKEDPYEKLKNVLGTLIQLLNSSRRD